jgi:hypothetical protein
MNDKHETNLLDRDVFAVGFEPAADIPAPAVEATINFIEGCFSYAQGSRPGFTYAAARIGFLSTRLPPPIAVASCVLRGAARQVPNMP